MNANFKNWYDERRNRYRPVGKLQVLLIGESPPGPKNGMRRFFYDEQLTGYDNLYKALAEAIYSSWGLQSEKKCVLQRLQKDGYWLIDEIEYPSSDYWSEVNPAELIPNLVRRCVALKPEKGVVICHKGVYTKASQSLRDAGVTVLHDIALRFPRSDHPEWVAQFKEGVRSAIGIGK